MVSDDCKIHRYVSLVRPWPGTIIERPNIVRIDTLVFAAIFGQQSWTMVKTVLKHNKYPFIRFAISELTGKDTSFVSMTHLIQEISLFMFLQYGVGGHVWAAILDLNVKMISEHSYKHPFICMMPEITGNDSSFAFMPSLYQEKSLFQVFNMTLAAILDCHFEFENQTKI